MNELDRLKDEYGELYRLVRAIVNKVGRLELSKQDCREASFGRLEIIPTQDDKGNDCLVVQSVRTSLDASPSRLYGNVTHKGASKMTDLITLLNLHPTDVVLRCAVADAYEDISEDHEATRHRRIAAILKRGHVVPDETGKRLCRRLAAVARIHGVPVRRPAFAPVR